MRERWKRFRGWLAEWREAWQTMDVGAYRDGDAPTSDEMAARCVELESDLEAARQALAELALSAPATVKGLTPAQLALLAELIEECGEVQRAAAKVLQHGWEWRCGSGKGMPARVVLESELGHALAALEGLYGKGELCRNEIGRWKSRRLEPAKARTTSAQGSGQGQ